MGSILDIMILACGLYMLYSAYLMKSRGELKSGWLVSKNINLSNSRDVPGYINYMYSKVIIFSIATIIYAGIGIFNTYVYDIMTIQFLGFGVFFIFVIWFAVCSMKATKKYLY